MTLLNATSHEMLTMQYVIVGTIIAGALLWIIVRIVNRKKKGTTGGCAGCALAEQCGSARKKANSDCSGTNKTAGVDRQKKLERVP